MHKFLLIFALSCAATVALAQMQVAQLIHQKRPEDGRTADQYQADCAAGLSLSACGTIPISKDCEPGRHWSVDGSKVAHCVQNDMDCASGSRLEHDVNGNPSCVTIVCPPEQSWSNGSCVGNNVPAPPQVALPAPGFDGMVYMGGAYPGDGVAALNIPSQPWFAKLNLILNTGTGSWQVAATGTANPGGCCTPVVAPNSGIWTATPAATYQYRISAVVYGPVNPGFPVGRPYNVMDTPNYWTLVTPFPEAATDWVTLPANSLVAVGGINMNMRGGCSYVTAANFPLDLRFTLQLRNAAEPRAVSTSVFELVFHFTDLASCSNGG